MSFNKKLFTHIGIVGSAVLLIAGCGSSSVDTTTTETNNNASSNSVVQGPTIETNSSVADQKILIDVRTPQEYSEGHIEGALNINVESPDFLTKISELDPNASYEVYCRSGRRSAVAVEEMTKQGFGNISDLGGFDAAVNAKQKPVVSGMQ